MNETFLRNILVAWIITAVLVFISLFFLRAPYGRYFVPKSMLAVNGKLSWILMEIPAPLIFATYFFTNMHMVTFPQVVFLAMWEIHYIDRAVIYPLMRRISLNPMPLIIIAAGISFNFINAYLNSNYIITNTNKYSEYWLSDFRFYSGMVIYLMGFIMNRHSDYILYRIRLTSAQDYYIPQEGFHRWISCPNYLGEIMIWIGWAVATWSPVAAAFSIWTIANLAPRARSHHQWYRQHFDDYPNNRRALVPWLR